MAYSRTCILGLLVFLLSMDIFAQEQLVYGQIIDSVQCETSKAETYALYLPSNYTKDRSWPVIFIFEPAARGKLPVTQYKPVAEELGYIVIASNNSKNGNWDNSLRSARAIFKDGSTKFNLDSTRIYTSGFSGGSRVAYTLAIIYRNIAGVIGCGAGFSSIDFYQPSSQDNYVYVGIVGDKDMNYQEHILIENDLDEVNVVNKRIIFSAGHQWPRPDQLKEAVYWLELQSLKRTNKTSPGFRIDTIFNRMKFKADSLYSNERFLMALRIYEDISEDFEGLVDLTAIESQINKTQQIKQLSRLRKKENKLNIREREHHITINTAFNEIRYTNLMVTYDSTKKTKQWWFNEIDSLNSVTKNKNVDKKNTGYRILNLIWAKFATSSFSYEKSQDYQTAIRLNDVCLYAQPKSIWALWNMAKIQSLAGNVEQSLDYLYKAKEVGMKYRKSIQNKSFENLKENPRYTSLLSELITNN
jgi:tetratricopeptide (TPR) repeat protein